LKFDLRNAKWGNNSSAVSTGSWTLLLENIPLERTGAEAIVLKNSLSPNNEMGHDYLRKTDGSDLTKG
jgi:hypothetical protein